MSNSVRVEPNMKLSRILYTSRRIKADLIVLSRWVIMWTRRIRYGWRTILMLASRVATWRS